ncbi:xanthine dehydrogenase small subunit [Salinispirillum sp. LH 10-3-1]|uniref:Xanthine dehydrogenase small subunit n=1 Tax=Salinispirillum sp. LH 10-3-1 TaxID=2952525 RepID=A0AB38YH32_9GAMM
MIQFLLNQDVQTEHELDPNTTVLNYLREHRGKTGTKEGCASGDCGACTVVVGELVGNDIRYRTLNSCLTFVPALHGKQLITVEDLKHDGKLHDVQQAMADCHGSQCGFCTPGFVMSLFALNKNRTDYNQSSTLEALSGNLCRCTGYRPILAAAEQAALSQQPDHFDAQRGTTVQQLQQIAPTEPTEWTANGHRCFIPQNTDQLAALYKQNPNARLLAGGTDLALEVTQFHRPLATLIYLGQVSDLKTIEAFSDRLEIGAAASLTDCYDALTTHYSDFGELLHRFASLQIRNQGTLGGNIGNASPIGDSPPLLIALNAQIQLRCAEQRRSIALEDFFLDYRKTDRQPGEFIEKIIVPLQADVEFRAYKVSKRIDDDISAVCAAFALHISDGVVASARLAFGGMAATPKRAAHCEQALLNQPWSEATIEQACLALAQDFTPLSDFRASKEYRLLTAQNLLRKYYLELTPPHATLRVTDYV